MKFSIGITLAMIQAAVFASEVETAAAVEAAVKVEATTDAAATAEWKGDADEYLRHYNAHIPKAEEIKAAPKKGVRGGIKQSRRRDAPKGELDRFDGLVLKKDDHKGRTYDWREYEPDLYDGKNPYGNCVFPEDRDHLDTPEYQSMSAMCKEELIWQNILGDGTRERFFKGPEFNSLFSQDMNLTYDAVTDTMPINRKKVTHPVGCVSKLEFIAHPDSKYTGVFRGAKHVIQRISETVPTVPHKTKTAPGNAVKFLRDGMHSGNFVAMFSFDGQDSFNFFKNRWTTILREPNNKCARATIGRQLATVTDHIGATSVMDLALFDEQGREEPDPHWPYEINVEAYDVYGWGDEYENDFQDQMSVIPINTVQYKLIGFDEPPELGGEEILMGWLVTRSDQISSLWGDKDLFFQHRRMDDDIKRRPHYFDWLQFWDNGKHNDTPLQDPAPGQKCPFFFLFNQAGLV